MRNITITFFYFYKNQIIVYWVILETVLYQRNMYITPKERKVLSNSLQYIVVQR